MIFDCDKVTPLVLVWQENHDPRLLDEILMLSQKLIEAIISSYDYRYRDDLIQEVKLKYIYALPRFDPNIANLHTFLTTVARNICNTYIQKQAKHDGVDIEQLYSLSVHEKIKDEDVLSELVSRNRKRFPSLPVEEIDDITETIYYCLIDNDSKRSIIVELCDMYDCSKKIATVVFHSTLMYMRYIMRSYIDIPIGEGNDEWSLLPDIKEIFGDEVYTNISKVMSGVYVRFP